MGNHTGRPRPRQTRPLPRPGLPTPGAAGAGSNLPALELREVDVRYRFLTCDVFTETRFGGNQLAVLPAADGLSDGQMQAIAREFNYAETAFVLPAEAGHTRRV